MAKTLIEKIKDLKYFAGLRDLKIILVDFLSTVTALETNSVVVGRFKYYQTQISQGTPLIIGNKYRVSLELGDDFTNVGYLENGVYFIATATTPTTWSNFSSVRLITEVVEVFFNDLDSTFQILFLEPGVVKMLITNSTFNPTKTYPQIQGVSSFTLSDLNTIDISDNEGSDVNVDFNYFKIEVYN